VGLGPGIRVGIDVGGTFTDAVAIDSGSFELIGYVKVPTTHRAEDGVARGIVDALRRLLADLAIDVGAVRFISHGTTQATNALLEGDVAVVGIVGIGGGLEGFRARSQTSIAPIELAPGKYLRTLHRFLPTGAPSSGEADEAIRRLVAGGAEVILASGLYSVDDPSAEIAVVEAAARAGIAATGTHEISKLYGLRTRTRTAVINASILPRMVATADSVERAVTESGIAAPLMIMRGDGGVMSLGQLRRRPILTLLSGPAAGVAGALMHERVSDAIFLEVGGTSVDASAIRDGRVQVRYATIGGHRTYLQSLDVRSLGIGGGSIVRLRDGHVDVGPRSAHIAGLEYAVYQRGEPLDDAKLVRLRPLPGDPEDYVAIEAGGRRLALTLSCAANVAGFVESGDWARGDVEAARGAFVPLARELGVDVEAAASMVVDAAVSKVRPTVEALAADYRMDRRSLLLVGGGGAAATLVPALARALGCEYRITRNAHVVSPIGVALALVRDVVERMIPNPTSEDLRRVRDEAEEAAVAAGAARETIEVDVVFDARRSVVRATATGATELRSRDLRTAGAGESERRRAAARSLSAEADAVELTAQTPQFSVYKTAVKPSGLLRRFAKAQNAVRVVDREGVVRLRVPHAQIVATTTGETPRELRTILDALTTYGDAGKMLPVLHLLVRDKIVNLSGLPDPELVVSVAIEHLRSLESTEPSVIVAECRT
jgi:N-methylhydantoinase A